MSFLAPAFLLGALAIALPIVFHLIRRTSREKTIFSSLMFLLATPPRVTRRSRLENLWLLLLRCLVLLLLALGFARPFLQRPFAAGGNSGPGVKLVVLLDISASMRRAGIWPEAQSRAVSVVEKAGPLDQVSIVAFDQHIRTVLSFDDWARLATGDRKATALRRIKDLSPGWESTHLGNALIAAAESLEEPTATEASARTRSIVLISDLQEGSRLKGLQGHDWPKGIEVTVEQVKPKKPGNAGVYLVTDAVDKAGASAEPKVRVSNSSESTTEQLRIGWLRPDGSVLASNQSAVYVPPGQSRVVPLPKNIENAVGLMLTGDEAEFDNVAYVLPPTQEQIPILYLGSHNERDPDQPLYYLKRVFQQTRSQSIQIIARAATNAVSELDVASIRFAIIADQIPEGQISVAKSFLANGKTVLFVMRSLQSGQTLAQLLGMGSLETSEAAVSGYAMLSQLDFEHPLLSPFADPRFSDFTKIHFWKYRKFDAAKMPKAHVVARFEKGDPALVQIPVGKGTLLVLASSWHPADSQLALSSKFVPLLYSMLDQSGSLPPQKTQYAVGDDVPLPASSKEAPLTIRRADGTEEKTSERNFHPQSPGIYAVKSASADTRFAVNLEPEESKTAPMVAEDLQRLGVPLHLPALEDIKLAEKKRRHMEALELENRQKIWRWLIVAVLVVLIMETWLAGWLTRRAARTAA